MNVAAAQNCGATYWTASVAPASIQSTRFGLRAFTSDFKTSVKSDSLHERKVFACSRQRNPWRNCF